MRDGIRHERLLRLQRFLAKMESTHPPPHLVERWTQTLVDLYLGYLRAENPDWPNSKISYRDALESLRGEPTIEYIHDPVQKRANAIRKVLATGDQGAVDQMLKKLASKAEGRAIGSEIQAHNRSHGNKSGPYEDLLDDLYRADPGIGHKQLDRKLRNLVGKGVIDYINDSTGEIILTDGRTFKTSGLKDQIYRRRKLL
jgi:hypothetical protein